VRAPGGDDHIDLETDELDRKLVLAIEPSLRPPVLDGDVLSFTIAEVCQPLSKPFPARRVGSGRKGRQVSDPRDLPSRLRLGVARRGEKHHRHDDGYPRERAQRAA
jgi:hypothetical protein